MDAKLSIIILMRDKHIILLLEMLRNFFLPLNLLITNIAEIDFDECLLPPRDNAWHRLPDSLIPRTPLKRKIT